MKTIRALMAVIGSFIASQIKGSVGIGGTFYLKQYRDGVRINAFGKPIPESTVEPSCNMFIGQGLIYALNCAFGTTVGGAPTPLPALYIGLTSANRSWSNADIADAGAGGIHTVGAEVTTYSEATRPAWNPQALATLPGDVQINDTGFETTFTMTAAATVRGAMTISAAAKDGNSDTGAVLVAGSDFPTPRVLQISDVFKVGYILKAENKV